MLKIIVSAIFLGSLALAGAAGARPGQCYTAEGRPTGPAYDSVSPDREWIRFVTARGGRCTGLEDEAASAQPRFSAHETPNHRHLLRFHEMQRD